MTESIRLLSPENIDRNPENPRLIFHQDELDALQESIRKQGILVPLTVYRDEGTHYLIDGERRWRSALKLGLSTVPVIVQPKPDRMQNLMMMFAIHHRRNDWDPLPTAQKLQVLEELFTQRQGRRPTESELAEVASLTRGEVRRLKKLLALPQVYRDELLEELNKPRSQQIVTVDHVIEATNAAVALRKRGIIKDLMEEDTLRRALLDKFRSRIVTNTVAPRKLARMARAVSRGELPAQRARQVVERLIKEPSYSIDDAFAASVEQADFEHGLEQLIDRLAIKLNEHSERRYHPRSQVVEAARRLRKTLKEVLGV